MKLKEIKKEQMDVSTWKKIGKERGYWKYFENDMKEMYFKAGQADLKNKIIKWIDNSEMDGFEIGAVFEIIKTL